MGHVIYRTYDIATLSEPPLLINYTLSIVGVSSYAISLMRTIDAAYHFPSPLDYLLEAR